MAQWVEHLPSIYDVLDLTPPGPRKPGMVAHTCKSSTERAGDRGDQKFKVILSYVASSTPAWATRDRLKI